MQEVDMFVEAYRGFVFSMFMTVLPPILISLVIVILFGVFQAVMQIQEQTLSFFPKVAALVATYLIFAPWIYRRMTEDFDEMMRMIPSLL